MTIFAAGDVNSTQMYAIVEFETKEIEMVPLRWITTGCGITAVKIGLTVNCYWPPLKSLQKISNAIKNCVEPSTDWPVYSSRVLGIASK